MLQFILDIIQNESIDPNLFSFLVAMLQDLLPDSKVEEDSLLILPSLCNHVINGESFLPTPVTSAWALLYTALYLLNKIEDKETKNLPLRIDDGCITNLTTVLIFLAQTILNSLENEGIKLQSAQRIRQNINQTVLSMCAAQHQDLTQDVYSLEDGWDIYGKKSGLFFACGAYIGVICTNDNEVIAKKTAEYGFHLGLLVQIANDIKDFQSDLTLWGNHHISILYAKDILPELKKKQLLFFLSQQKKREACRKDIRDLLIENGALIYLGLSIEKHKILARQALLSLALSETGLLTLTRRLDLF